MSSVVCPYGCDIAGRRFNEKLDNASIVALIPARYVACHIQPRGRHATTTHKPREAGTIMGLSRRQFFKISAGAVAATMADSVMTGAAPWSKLIRENPGSDGHRRFTLMQDERRAASSETARTQRGTTFNPLHERHSD
jgi:hypothetical protein